jgi:hypothetical protein
MLTLSRSLRAGVIAVSAGAAAFAASVSVSVGPLAAATPSSAPAAPARSAAAAAAVRTVCTGVARCHVVARTDVDGDGRTDQVGMVADLRASDANRGIVTIRVRTADGKTLATTRRSVAWFGKDADAWYGAAHIDGRRGTELVVGQQMGAHSTFFRVITYRGGALVTLRAPKPPARTGRVDDTSLWYTDASVNFHDGYTRSRSKGAVYMNLTTAERNASGKGHSGWNARYRWAHGGWHLVLVKRVHYTTEAGVAHAGGWHVAGLPLSE